MLSKWKLIFPLVIAKPLMTTRDVSRCKEVAFVACTNGHSARMLRNINISLVHGNRLLVWDLLFCVEKDTPSVSPPRPGRYRISHKETTSLHQCKYECVFTCAYVRPQKQRPPWGQSQTGRKNKQNKKKKKKQKKTRSGPKQTCRKIPVFEPLLFEQPV